MRGKRLIVLKFGGSVLRSEDRLRIAVHEVYRWRREGWGVVAVVSALAGRTDALLARCDRVCDRATALARAAVVAGGEMESASLLGLHLDRAGVPAAVLTPGAAGFRADGDALDATPRSIDAGVFERLLESEGVVVFPGFVAIDEMGRTVTLGRGGSDLTALFLAHALGRARCRLVKDVDGLYEEDPAEAATTPRRFAVATYEDVLATDGSIVQHKAVRLVRGLGMEFELGRFNGMRPTRIGGGPTSFAQPPDAPERRRVALLGLGTVGGGVLALLRELPELFEVTGAAVRSRAKHAACGLGADELWTDAVALAGAGADIVVEAMGGVDVAAAAVEAAMLSGADVVTANKALIAERGGALCGLARRLGRRLLFSASVGGAMPALERAAAGPVRSLRGVLNGTSNFVLDAMERGAGFDAAVWEARRLGLAEADPSRDLDGRDSLDKLMVLGQVAGWDGAGARGLAAREPVWRDGGAARTRHIARLDARGHAGVRMEHVEPGDSLYDVPEEWNALEIERQDGSREVVRGRGAGRWPTAESVMADVLETARVEAALGAAVGEREPAVGALRAGPPYDIGE